MALKLIDPCLIGADNRGIARLNDAIQQTFYLGIDVTKLLTEGFLFVMRRCQAHIPSITHHRFGQFEEPFGWLQAF
ncbi:hypothetical protein KBY28_18385 [Ruegeria pomeroyi]|uniref:hypothetical protein n=1 Tax=Ruegeria pomeroyi TaxID=89184 RepID=UPI001F3C137D|nr:hypothetical protein [Ruegeria pomeroyi]MCE8510426.1 hypothetical protein [Ruegeria pomeroyi]